MVAMNFWHKLAGSFKRSRPPKSLGQRGEDAAAKFLKRLGYKIVARSERNRRRISGAIFQVELDRTHPLGFGHAAAELPVFRRDTRLMELDPDPYANVARYTESPLLSGYASPENQERIAGTAAVIARRLGRGTVILLADNPNFRGFWYGTNKLYANALFFAHAIKRTSALDEPEEEAIDSHGHGHNRDH